MFAHVLNVPVTTVGEALCVLVSFRLLDAYDEHQALLKEQESLKRRAENG